MTEAVHALISYGFGKLSLRQIWATADIENTQSWRLMERVGMYRKSKVRMGRNVRSNWRESYVYAVLEPEYRLRFSSNAKSYN